MKIDTLTTENLFIDLDIDEPIIGRSFVVIGDVHGEFSKLHNNLCNIISYNTIYIVLGDSGLMNEKYFERTNAQDSFLYIDELLKIYNSKLFFGRGNHDNPFYFKEYKPNIFKKYNNIFSLPDHSLIKYKDKHIFWIGGGLSIDRTQRTRGVTYFKDEATNFDFKLFKKINKEYSPEIILSHGLPAEAYPQTLSTMVLNYCEIDKPLFGDLKKERSNYSKALKIFDKCEKWYSGHYHSSNGNVLHYHKEPTLCQNINCLEFKEIYF